MQEMKIDLNELEKLEQQANELGFKFPRMWLNGYYWYCKLKNIPNTKEEMEDYYLYSVIRKKGFKLNVNVLINEMDGQKYLIMDFDDAMDFSSMNIEKVYSERF